VIISGGEVASRVRTLLSYSPSFKRFLFWSSFNFTFFVFVFVFVIGMVLRGSVMKRRFFLHVRQLMFASDHKQSFLSESFSLSYLPPFLLFKKLVSTPN